MRNLWAYVVLVSVGLISPSIMFAQTASESGQAMEHKGDTSDLPGRGRFNCASPPVKGQVTDTEPGPDEWGRTPKRREAGFETRSRPAA